MARTVYIHSADAGLRDSLVSLMYASGIDTQTGFGPLRTLMAGPQDMVLIDLEGDAEDLYGGIDTLMHRPNGPHLVLLAGNRSAFEADDSFARPNVTLLLPPIDPRRLITLASRTFAAT